MNEPMQACVRCGAMYAPDGCILCNKCRAPEDDPHDDWLDGDWTGEGNVNDPKEDE